MSINKNIKNFPYLLTREQASNFLGIYPVSFDKYIRPHDNLEYFMIGRHDCYTMKSLINFIESQSI
ncbi:DNA-binding protein [Staphylococcus hominis]|uniref:DNA-binding protein n=1 Tax=Staphylococcus hominis TaxID=1290 RepID=UPI0011A999CA|nr:DNA-binding protein [Staphylococcus hominis]